VETANTNTHNEARELMPEMEAKCEHDWESIHDVKPPDTSPHDPDSGARFYECLQAEEPQFNVASATKSSRKATTSIPCDARHAAFAARLTFPRAPGCPSRQNP